VGHGERQGDSRAKTIGGVGEGERAAVVLEDSLDYGQAETSALFARRDIGLGQTATMLDRQTHAIVLHDEIERIAMNSQAGADAAGRD
jgi:hypothetical protein